MGAYLWLHSGTNFARITSTKYYDPTLQGGKAATYEGPRRDDVYIACDRSLAYECEGKLFSLAPGVKYPQVLSGVSAASGPDPGGARRNPPHPKARVHTSASRMIEQQRQDPSPLGIAR